MFNIFDSLKPFFKFRRITTGGFVFALHYRATVGILLMSCVVVAARQYVGDPIDCIHGKDLPHNVVDAFCWLHSTFSIRSAFLKRVGADISHPGIDNSLGGHRPNKQHRYYQWVAFCLFMQVSVGSWSWKYHTAGCSVWLWTWLILRLFNEPLLNFRHSK